MAKDVFATLDTLAEEVGHLRNQLSGLYSILGKTVTPSRKTRRRDRRAVKKVTRKARKAASPKLKAMRKLQGQYMGFVRNLTAAQKAQVKKVKESKGFAAAIKMAKRLTK